VIPVSAVLRKKIEMATGIPPTLLQIRTFWSGMCDLVAAWAGEALGAECGASIAERKVVGGKGVKISVDSPYAFYFSAEASPGLCAIKLDQDIAVRNAAARLQQDTDGFDAGSGLFLKLLAEQSVLSLWQKLAEELGGHDVYSGFVMQQDASAVAGALGEDARYMRVDVDLDFDGKVSRISFVFLLDFLMRFAREYMEREVRHKAEVHSASPKSLNESVRASSIELDGVLGRLPMSVGDCALLEVGQILPLAGVDPGRLLLSAGTLKGSVDIGSGELGVWKKHRALKMHTPVSESFVRELIDFKSA